MLLEDFTWRTFSDSEFPVMGVGVIWANEFEHFVSKVNWKYIVRFEH